MNSPTLAPWLALLLSLFGAGSEAVAQNAERSFNVKEIQLSTSESYQILASGHFGLPGCGRILAVKNGTEQFFQLGVRAEPVPVTGLEHPELWEGAATVDINSDGYTDLIVHEPGSVKIRIAISNGPGRFTVYEPGFVNL